MGDFRFPKHSRLRLRCEFQRVRAEGESKSCRFFVMNALLAPDLQGPRVGIITTRKGGVAVHRSRMRRLLREIFRRHAPSLRSDLWLVVVARAPLADAVYSEVESQWLRLAASLSIMDGST